MRIGFDAYFAFHYKTGVAHYSRNLVNSLAKFYPDTELILFTDKQSTLYQPSFSNIKIIELGYDVPYHQWLINNDLLSAIESEGLDVFHGMDHGLPNIRQAKTVVTIHDLFFESHPELYTPADVQYYRRVAPEACRKAGQVISISDFTRKVLVLRYNVEEEKVKICYQTCNSLFFETVTGHRKQELRHQFNLPDQFWLYVGSVTERKNLLNICKAMQLIKDRSTIPLMVIGEGDEYLGTVRSFIHQNQLYDRIRFLSYTDAGKNSVSFQQAKDVPAFYQMALALLYPSYLEGFGIPLIEAFASNVPVLTSGTSSLPEIGGDAAMYVDPSNENEIATALLQMEKDEDLRSSMIKRGKKILQHFTEEKTAASVMNVYQQLL